MPMPNDPYRAPTSADTREMDRRGALTRWLVAGTRALPQLTVAVLARILGHLIAAAVLVTAAAAILGLLGAVSAGKLLLLFAALSVVKSGLRYLEHYAGHWVAFTSLQRLRELLFARLVPQAPAATTGRGSAALTELATRDIDRIEVFFAHTIPPVIAAVAVPAVALTWFALAVDPAPAAIIAVFLAAALLLPFVAARSSWAAAREELDARAELATHVADDIQGIREVLAFGAEELRLGELSERHARVTATRLRVGRTIALRHLLARLLWGACLIAVLLSGRPVSAIVLAVALLAGLWLADAGADDFATGLDTAFAAAARLRRVCDAPPTVRDEGRRDLSGSGAVALEITDLRFGYPAGGAPAVSDVALSVAPRAWHYVAGVSGSGKSTLAALLIRAWDPDAGGIRLDGVPLSDIPLDVLRAAVAVVEQRPVLFTGTLADNLRLARPDATDAELAAALYVAALPPEELPGGLAAPVGERGATLSGGQVQRVALARALVARPRLLVLDEALSQLDADTAGIVRERLTRLLDGLTVVEITHRTDVVPDDAVVTVLDGGRIIEQGAAGALRSRGGAFARLSLRDGAGADSE